MISYVKNEYNTDPEFLWKKFDSEEASEIIDLRMTPEDIEKRWMASGSCQVII